MDGWWRDMVIGFECCLRFSFLPCRVFGSMLLFFPDVLGLLRLWTWYAVCATCVACYLWV